MAATAIHTFQCLWPSGHIYVHVYIYIYIYMYIICIYTYIYTYVYIYINKYVFPKHMPEGYRRELPSERTQMTFSTQSRTKRMRATKNIMRIVCAGYAHTHPKTNTLFGVCAQTSRGQVFLGHAGHGVHMAWPAVAGHCWLWLSLVCSGVGYGQLWQNMEEQAGLAVAGSG